MGLIRITRRRVLILAALLLLVGITVVVWRVADWPPPRLILMYGFPPTGGPTGRTTVIEGIEFVELMPGYFRMGSHYKCERGDLLGRIGAAVGLSFGTAPKHAGGECPTRWVEVRSRLWMARTEVTNAQFARFQGRDLFWDEGRADYPRGVSWQQADTFCRRLADASGFGVRLPSEAEWEYCCRAGSSAIAPEEDPGEGLQERAWFDGNSGGDPHPVATLAANEWGLHDMLGNVAEWCEDRPGDDWPYRGYEDHANTSRAFHAPDAEGRSVRGGHSNSERDDCRAASRMAGVVFRPFVEYGFRPVFTSPEDE
jgi:formylglycine-generating enzyme required for sulfatase activity